MRIQRIRPNVCPKFAQRCCWMRSRTRSRSVAASVTNLNSAGDGGRKTSPILLRSHPLDRLEPLQYIRDGDIFRCQDPVPYREYEPTISNLRGLVRARFYCRSPRPLTSLASQITFLSLSLYILVILPTCNVLLGLPINKCTTCICETHTTTYRVHMETS
jgi:hypothetical protein